MRGEIRLDLAMLRASLGWRKWLVRGGSAALAGYSVLVLTRTGSVSAAVVGLIIALGLAGYEEILTRVSFRRLRG